jgi:hypothetical protein
MLPEETRELSMLRGVTLLLLTVATGAAAFGADMPDRPPRHSRMGPSYGPPPVNRDPDVLFTPALPTIPPLIRTPFLPGSAALPGYYGTTHSYDYQGPYYGGPYTDYRDRLPYACGVYGYC